MVKENMTKFSPNCLLEMNMKLVTAGKNDKLSMLRLELQMRMETNLYMKPLLVEF